MVSKTRPFDAANYLADPLMQAMYLSVAMEEGDAGDVAGALGVVARAGHVLRGA